MNTIPPPSRRRFVATTATAALAATIVPRHVLGGPGFVAPSDKVNVALIGAGGQGLHNARALFQEKDCQVIAIADPAEDWDLSEFYYGGRAGRGPVAGGDRGALRARRRRTTRAPTYEDFRVMLEKEKAIDAVLVATPDHLHAYVSILAMKAGKHVYCEKPLTHNVWEARTVARVAAETGVATQMGNQGRSGEGHRQTVEWIRDGAIGAVREVHAWSGSMGIPDWTTRPEGTPEAPRGAELGPVARPPRRASLPPRLRAVHVAQLLGLRRRRPARHGRPQPRPRLQRARTSTRRRRWRPRRPGSTTDPCSSGVLVNWRFGARGGPRAAVRPLVRRRPAAADAARDRPRRPEAAARRGGQRHPVRRRAGAHHLRGLVRHAPPPAPRAAPRATSAPRRRSRGSRATTRTGCRPARAARPPAAPSPTGRGSPSSSCSATWPCARAGCSRGTPRA